MTTIELQKRMAEIDSFRGDKEAAHSCADSLLCEVLKEEGYQDLADWFDSLEKWYA